MRWKAETRAPGAGWLLVGVCAACGGPRTNGEEPALADAPIVDTATVGSWADDRPAEANAGLDSGQALDPDALAERCFDLDLPPYTAARAAEWESLGCDAVVFGEDFDDWEPCWGDALGTVEFCEESGVLGALVATDDWALFDFEDEPAAGGLGWFGPTPSDDPTEGLFDAAIDEPWTSLVTLSVTRVESAGLDDAGLLEELEERSVAAAGCWADGDPTEGVFVVEIRAREPGALSEVALTGIDPGPGLGGCLRQEYALEYVAEPAATGTMRVTVTFAPAPVE